MEPFTTHTGVAVPLQRSAVDTDQIIPAVYLKRVTKTGFEDALFAHLRQEPDFVLNDPAYAGGSVLIAGVDFGTGSSREHAVWALRDAGFRAVFSPRFGDIFRGNAGKQGLLTGVISEADLATCHAAVLADPGIAASVDLDARTLSIGALTVPFEIDEYTRWRLMEGLDDIALTLQSEAQITAFEEARAPWRPRTIPVRTT